MQDAKIAPNKKNPKRSTFSSGYEAVEAFQDAPVSLTVQWRNVLNRHSIESTKRLGSLTPWRSETTTKDSSQSLDLIQNCKQQQLFNGILNSNIVPPLYCLGGNRFRPDDPTDFNPKSPSLNLKTYQYVYKMHEIFSPSIVLKEETKKLLEDVEPRGLQTMDYFIKEQEGIVDKKDKEKLHKAFVSEYRQIVSENSQYRDALSSLDDDSSLKETVENLVFLHYYYTRNCYFSLGYEYNTPLDLASKFGLDSDAMKQNCLQFLSVVLHKVEKAIATNLKETHGKNEFVEVQPVFVQAVHADGSIKAKVEGDREVLEEHYKYVRLRGHNHGKAQQHRILEVKHLKLLISDEKSRARKVLETLVDCVFVRFVLRKAFLVFLRKTHFSSEEETAASKVLPDGKPDWFLKDDRVEPSFKKQFQSQIKRREIEREVSSQREESYMVLGSIPDGILDLGNADEPDSKNPSSSSSSYLLVEPLEKDFDLSGCCARLKSLLKSSDLIPYGSDASLTAVSTTLLTSIKGWLKEKASQPTLLAQVKKLKENVKQSKEEATLTMQDRNARKLACMVHTNALKWCLGEKSKAAPVKRAEGRLMLDFIVQLQPSFKKNLLLTFERVLLKTLHLKPLVPASLPKKAIEQKLSKDFKSCFDKTPYSTVSDKKNKKNSKVKYEEVVEEVVDDEEEEEETEDSSAYDDSELDSSMDSVSLSDSEDDSFVIEEDCGSGSESEEELKEDGSEKEGKDLDAVLEKIYKIPSTKEEEKEKERRRKERRRQKKEEKRRSKKEQRDREEGENRTTFESKRSHLRRNAGPVVKYVPSFDDNADNQIIQQETKRLLEARKQKHKELVEHMSSLPPLQEPKACKGKESKKRKRSLEATPSEEPEAKKKKEEETVVDLCEEEEEEQEEKEVVSTESPKPEDTKEEQQQQQQQPQQPQFRVYNFHPYSIPNIPPTSTPPNNPVANYTKLKFTDHTSQIQNKGK